MNGPLNDTVCAIATPAGAGRLTIVTRSDFR
jgi:hypothetical protein